MVPEKGEKGMNGHSHRRAHQSGDVRAGRWGLVFVCLLFLLCFFFVWNINSGSVSLSVPEILDIIFRGGGDETSRNIVWQIRLPRILAAMLLGGALTVSGFLLQTFSITLLPAPLCWVSPPGQS